MLQSDPLRLLPDDFEKQSADSSLSKLDEDVDKFLNVVEKCVSQFGESIALINLTNHLTTDRIPGSRLLV